ncbi:hypothetical protein Taro_021545 [Colocasia esculenta]|uniref:BPL/LPL catalytic domain-containing protein n=1 Tax=Colocasia esculenta TaxID=4460 RepID=A0A843V1J4_COLES|nr:hypothetical protein [Colocasia esculenta]
MISPPSLSLLRSTPRLLLPTLACTAFLSRSSLPLRLCSQPSPPPSSPPSPGSSGHETLSSPLAAMGDAASSLSSSRDGCLLVLCGKSSAEEAQARSLASSGNLKLLGAGEEVALSLSCYGEGDLATMGFRAQEYMDALSTRRFGRFLAWSPRLPSTHDIVSRNFCELPLGAVCVADVQFKGRGRTGNVWESPAGCLMFSFTLEMEDGRVVPLLQYVVSLAVTEAIKGLCHAKVSNFIIIAFTLLVSLFMHTLADVREGLPNLSLRIKWPNDLYLNGLKLGGILCTSSYRSKKFHVSAGVGLNVDNEKPTLCLNSALKDANSSSHSLHKEEILASFFNNFEHLFETFLNKGDHLSFILLFLHLLNW